MQINALLGTIADQLPGLQKRSEASDSSAVATASQTPAAAASTATSTTTSAADEFREILSDYDVSSISPDDFTEMLDRLRKTGLLTEQQYRGLSQVRSELEAGGVKPDEEVDLVDFYSKRVAEMRASMLKAGDNSTTSGQGEVLSAMQSRLEWLQKFALVQSGEKQGFDSMA